MTYIFNFEISDNQVNDITIFIFKSFDVILVWTFDLTTFCDYEISSKFFIRTSL